MKRSDPVYIQYSRKILVKRTEPTSVWSTPIMLVLLILLCFGIGLLWISWTAKTIKPYQPHAQTESACTTDQDCAEQFAHDPCAGAPARAGDDCQA